MVTRDELEDRVWVLAKEYSYNNKYTADLEKVLANKEWIAREPAFEHYKTPEDIIETDIWKNVALALSGRVLDYIKTGSWGAN